MTSTWTQAHVTIRGKRVRVEHDSVMAIVSPALSGDTTMDTMPLGQMAKIIAWLDTPPSHITTIPAGMLPRVAYLTRRLHVGARGEVAVLPQNLRDAHYALDAGRLAYLARGQALTVWPVYGAPNLWAWGTPDGRRGVIAELAPSPEPAPEPDYDGPEGDDYDDSEETNMIATAYHKGDDDDSNA